MILDPFTYLTYNPVLPNTIFEWAPRHANSNVVALLTAAGGGGFGSETNMDYDNDGHPIPYGQYGKMGGAVCLDTYEPVQVLMENGKITWPNHPMCQSQGVFFTDTTGFQGLVPMHPYFVIGNNDQIWPPAVAMKANEFWISERTYAPPGGMNFPSVPAAVIGSGLIWMHIFRYTIPGSMGGGVRGDQSGPQAAVFPNDGSGIWFPGESGECVEGAGGPGGSSLFGRGGIAQNGTWHGNDGGDPGGGGSAGGMGTPASPILMTRASGPPVLVRPYNMAQQTGGAGGAGGGYGLCVLTRKPSYYYFCGQHGLPGTAGPGGWNGGRGGNSLLLFIEL